MMCVTLRGYCGLHSAWAHTIHELHSTAAGNVNQIFGLQFTSGLIKKCYLLWSVGLLRQLPDINQFLNAGI